MGFVKKVKRAVLFFSLVTMGFGLQACLETESEESKGSSGSSETPSETPSEGRSESPSDGSSESPSEETSGRTSLDCPDGFTGVPGNDFYGTEDFCVMKFEAKAVHKITGQHSLHGCLTEACNDGTSTTLSEALDVGQHKASAHWDHKPWVRITRDQAITACESMGEGYDLITNDQWQTIARNIENEEWNWGLTVGGSQRHEMSVGNVTFSDEIREALPALNNNRCVGGPCGSGGAQRNWHLFRRSHKLSTNSLIWDISGNVAEWVKDDLPGGAHQYEANDYVSALSGPSFTDENPLRVNGNLGPARSAKDQFGPQGDYERDTLQGHHGYLGYASLVMTSNVHPGYIIRGGAYDDRFPNYNSNNPIQHISGIFSTYIWTSGPNEPPYQDKQTGFRCVWKPGASQP